jgi:hypothetical protein
VPIAALERHVFEKISLHGRGLAAANDLISAIDAFDKSIKYRNDLLDEMREGRLSDDNARAAWYFGLITENGIIDARYKMNVQAIYNQTDDCIFFSQILAADLLTYGNKLRKKGRRGFRFGISGLPSADWSEARRDGSIPPDEKYKAWLAGFKKQPSKWRRFVNWIYIRK